MKFQDRLEKQDACSKSLEWLKENKFKSKQAAWDACPRADWMLWAWSHNIIQGSKNHKKLVLASVACTRISVKYIKDKKLKKDVEKCLATTEGWARGENTLEEVEAARNAANAAANAADTASAAYAAYAAYYAADSADAVYAASAASDASFDAADAAYYAADSADSAYAAADREAALKEMADIVRKIQPKCPKFLKG